MRKLIALIFVFVAFASWADNIDKVSAEYTYVFPGNQSRDDAIQTAYERARIEALKEKYGTMITQGVDTYVDNENGKSNTAVHVISRSDVKGEWISDTKTEVKKIDVNEAGEVYVIVRVEGKARKIERAKLDWAVKILRNGDEDIYESDAFYENDNLFVSVQTPLNGYLAIYLVDADHQTVYTLLPYSGQTDGVYPIKANQRTVLFNEKKAPEKYKDLVQELVMTADKPREQNDIYVVFSKNSFVKTLDKQRETKKNVDGQDLELPRETTFKDFQKWLSDNRAKDVDFQTIIKTINISKK